MDGTEQEKGKNRGKKFSGKWVKEGHDRNKSERVKIEEDEERNRFYWVPIFTICIKNNISLAQ
jgi:hypothetical protein